MQQRSVIKVSYVMNGNWLPILPMKVGSIPFTALSIMGTVAWSKQEERVGAWGLAFGFRVVHCLSDWRAGGGLHVCIDCDSQLLARCWVTQNGARWRCLLYTFDLTEDLPRADSQSISPKLEQDTEDKKWRGVCFYKEISPSSRGRRHLMLLFCPGRRARKCK
jgi:hypothetical protein